MDKNMIIEKCDLQAALSGIMAEALGNECCDEPTIVTFALYLQLGAVQAIMEMNERIIKQLFHFNDDAEKNWHTEDEKEEIKALVTDILTQQQPSWVIKWMQVCTDALKQETTFYRRELHENLLCRRIIHLIHKQPGLTENNGLFLYDVTRYVLTEGLLNKDKVIIQ
jgi:hypothetical protein